MIFAVKPRTLVGATFLKFLAGNVNVQPIYSIFEQRLYQNHACEVSFFPVCDFWITNICSYWVLEIALVDAFMILWRMLHVKQASLLKFAYPSFAFFLTENDSAFDLLYCITFKLMDHEWLAMHASYMDFNVRSLQLLAVWFDIWICLFPAFFFFVYYIESRSSQT